jgi:hypothetical protein
MNDELWIHDILGGLTTNVAHTAVECVRWMFHLESEIREPWTVTPRLDGRFEYIFSLGSANPRFKSTMVVGIDVQSISAFIGCEVTLDEAKDAFSEFGNVYCGMVADIVQFTHTFGILKQGLPEEALHQACFPDAWAVQGKIYRGEQWMHVGYAIGTNRCDRPV